MGRGVSPLTPLKDGFFRFADFVAGGAEIRQFVHLSPILTAIRPQKAEIIKLYSTMNYLAHLYLAEDSPKSLLGNLLGDFIKGRSIDAYCDEIKKGIQLHQRVDRYTDLHPVFHESKRLISPVNRRYAGIIIDIFYDHFLAKNWLSYSSIPLEEFTRNVYKILHTYEAILPDSLKRVLPNITRRNLLMSYAELQGMKVVLERISVRLKRENHLVSALDDLTANYERFESDFSLFFPDLIDYVQALR